MRKHYLTGVAAIALALGVSAAPAQNVGQQGDIPQDTRSQQGAQDPQRTQTRQQGAEAEQGHNAGLIALDEGQQARISDVIRQQRLQPVTNLNFSLTVAAAVPSSVRLARISGELSDILPNYRDFSFFVARQELVIVDPQSNAIVGFVPISTGSTVGAASPRQDTAGGTVGVAPPTENTGPSGTAEPPAPAKKNAVRNQKKRDTVARDTVTEEKPKVTDRATQGRRSTRTETDVTLGTSRRDSDEVYEAPPRDRVIVEPPRERVIVEPPRERVIVEPPRERVEHDRGPPFPFSLLFGRWN